MPLFPGREYNFEQKMPEVIPPGEDNVPRPTGGPFGANGLIFNDGIVFRTEIDQVGTQFDGLGHAGTSNSGDPTKGKYFLNLKVEDVNATPNDRVDGLRMLGIEHVKPLMTRGILVDVAPFGKAEREPGSCDYNNTSQCWDVGDEITVADVETALAAQGMSLDDITSGDAVFINTGWGNLWRVDNDRFNSGMPGIGMEVGNRLVDKEVVLVGSDNWAVDVVPNGTLVFPLHQLFMTDNGIFLHEVLNFNELISAGVYEFMYVFVPVPFTGATGSPGNPIAVY
jgi:hypothetical protein